MPASLISSEQVLAALAAAPPRLAVLTADLSAAQLRASPAGGEWSATDVLAHLRACADVWGDCIATMLAHDRPTLRAVNPRSWIKRTDYREQDFQPSLHAYAAQRAALLAVLEPLAPDAWARVATVTGAGSPLERSVLSYARWMAGHERPHVKQIQRIVTTLRLEQERPASA